MSTYDDVRAWLGEDDPEIISAILATGTDDEATWVRVAGGGSDDALSAAARDYQRATEASDNAWEALQDAIRVAIRDGMSKADAHRISGVSRPTIDRIVRG